MKPDRRLTPARPDLAARHLSGVVEAARFADPSPHRVTAVSAPLRARPDAAASWDTELLHGEDFAVYDLADGWAWGQAGLDGYVGYMPQAALSAADGPAPDHRVSTQWASVYGRPVLKSAPGAALPFGARVRVAENRDGFVRIGPDRWLSAHHVAPLCQRASDWVGVAERFLGTPYVWGGRSPAGIDCSGLVQVARQAAGHATPRDSDMQAAGLGRTLAEGEAMRRGDLVFWRGHVAVMIDATRIVHATGRFMQTVVEPLAGAVERIAAAGEGTVTRRARLD